MGTASRLATLLAGFFVAFVSGNSLRAITITEIMYHPVAADEAALGVDRSLEWIEIYNEDGQPLHLSGYFFSNGISFTFPPDLYLMGREYLVVCADEAAVQEKYGITNTIGNFQLNLDNDGELIELNIYGGGPEVRVRYGDRGAWSHKADGVGHSLVLKNAFLDPDDDENWTSSPGLGGSPGGPNFDEPTIVRTQILDDDEVWRYRKGTSAYPAGWKDVGFNDNSWLSGQTGIGYSDGDDRTELNDMSGAYWSFAARKVINFTQEDIDSFEDLSLEISYDDGFVFYVNGSEVARGSMSGAPGSPVAFDQAASSHEAAGFEEFSFSKSVLRAGENVFACETHNTTLGSSDSSFVPRLSSVRIIQPTPAGDPVPVVINEIQYRDAASSWVEFFNTSSQTVDLSGFHVSTDRNVLDAWTLPAGSTIPGRGTLLVTTAASGLTFEGIAVGVYLSRPALTEVVAAELFENDPVSTVPDGFSEARAIDGLGRFSASATPTPDAPNEVPLETRIVINEIMYNPPRERADLEYVEIFNRGAETVDLTGFRFTRGISFDFADGYSIAAGDHVVIAKNPDAVENAHGIGGVLGPFVGSLSGSEELVRLRDSIGNIADQVHYFDGGKWPRLANGGGSSLELRDAFADNSEPGAWAASDESQKADWEVAEFNMVASQLEESEFQIRMLTSSVCLLDALSVTRSGTDYINNGGFESSTSPWRMQGNHGQSRRIIDEAFSGNACLKIVATGDGDLRVNRIEQDTRVFMNSGVYEISVALRWVSGGNLIYFSGYRQPQQSQRTYYMTYPENLGTPGATNSRAVSNLGPVISDVLHSPAVPGAAQAVKITARVSDLDGVQSVSAKYRVGSPSGVFSTAQMFDDGAHDDGAAGDGVYAGTVPGQNSGTRVVFYVEAVDDLGATWQFPVTAPQQIHVYQHDSSFTARGQTLRLIHDDTTWNQLRSRQLHSNEMLDATFIFNEQHVYYNVGTRYRGSPWNRPPNPKMYRIKFAKDNRYRGRTAINISRYGNAQKDRAAHYSTWRNSTPSTPSPMSRGIFSRFKDNSQTATMEQVDPVNKDYLKLWFPEDAEGRLFKILGKQVFDDNGGHRGNLIQWSTYTYRGTSPGAYRWNWNFRTREIEDDFSELSSMMFALSRSSTTLDNELEDIMDVEQFLRVYASRCAHDDWDTIAIGNGQNMYVYYAPNEGRFKLIPWDMDHTWGNTNARLYPDNSVGRFAQVINRPKFRRMYLGIFQEMLHGRGGDPGHWSSDEMVTKYLDKNTAAVGSDGVGSAGSIRNFINTRRNRIQGQIPSSTSFRITTNGGADMTVDEASVTLAGNAWVDVYQIVVGGENLDLSWSTTTQWRGEVPLEAGENELVFFAFDVKGNLLSSDEITVTSTTGWNSPELTSIDPLSAQPGETVTMVGTEFHDGIEVFFSGVEADSVVFAEASDPTSLTAVVPLLPPGPVDVTVRNVDNRSSVAMAFSIASLPPKFVRGDVNLDEVLDVSDPIRILGFLFSGLTAPCEAAADVDDDEQVAITDAIVALDYLFKGGPPPAAPYPARGYDPAGPLSCDEGLDPLG